MNIFESFRIAFRSLLSNKLRSLLTMLGIIIGVAAVITMISIGQGANANVTSAIQGLGSNLIFIQGSQAFSGGVAQGAGSNSTLKMKDIDALSKLPSVQAVTPINQRNAQIVFQGANTSTSVTGTTPSFTDVRNWQVSAGNGRFFTQDEVTSAAKVCTIGTTTVTNLFGSSGVNPVGQIIKINGIPFRVIGVMDSKGSSGFGDQDDAVYIPITTFQHRLLGGRERDSIRNIYASAKTADLTNQAISDIEFTLRRIHNLSNSQQDDFQVRNQADILSSAQSATDTMTYLLGGVAAISLLVGGIGIMNIMLVSVTERTREIGIRKAIGAKERHLLFQFLIESVTLSIIGGAIGIGLGYIGSINIGHMMKAPTVVSPNTVALSVLFSAAIGIIFGVVPARKASKLDPIEALRYE